MKFTTELTLPWSLERVADALQDPMMMQRVAAPFIRFTPIEPMSFPTRWVKGSTYRMRLALLGFLPMGWQQMTITNEAQPEKFTLIDTGPGQIVKQWDHRVDLTSVPGGTRYHETLILAAGLMTPIVWLGMSVVMWWRRRRWVALTTKT